MIVQGIHKFACSCLYDERKINAGDNRENEHEVASLKGQMIAVLLSSFIMDSIYSILKTQTDVEYTQMHVP